MTCSVPLVRQLVGLLVGVLLVAALGAVPAQASIDDYAGYEPQQTCTSVAKPGTVYLLHWLVRQYPHTGSNGTLRACDSGGVSEHKDGRAVDWGLDAADPAQVELADRFLERIFASDRQGNPDALARRMGIMYLIWNDHIYSAYADGFAKRPYLPCEKPKNCSKTSRHRDHMHISLSYAGAAAQTSFYRARHVPSIPVLQPGTRQLDPVSTAIVKVAVPANGTAVDAGFKVTRGTTYRVVGDGLYRYGAGDKVADAACRWSDDGWTAFEDGLLVNGTSPWAGDCAGTHTHSTTFTARRTQELRLSVGDPHPRGNAGTLTFYLLREDLATRSVASHYPAALRAPHPARHAGPSARRLTKERISVRAAARHGVWTTHALRRHTRYRVVVAGLATSGATVFDGACVKYAGRFRPQQSLDLTAPAADHLALYVAGVKVPLRVRGSKASCDRRDHRYVGSFRAPVRGKARVTVWDPFEYADNAGALTVTLTRRPVPR